jgi:HrpA-like RNA helicase
MYKNYFQDYAKNKHLPTLKCKTEKHKVICYYLDHLDDSKDSIEDKEIFPSYKMIQKMSDEALKEPKLCPELFDMVYDLLVYFDQLEIDEAKSKKEPTLNDMPMNRGAVLIFAPGWAEISQIKEYLLSNLPQNG